MVHCLNNQHQKLSCLVLKSVIQSSLNEPYISGHQSLSSSDCTTNSKIQTHTHTFRERDRERVQFDSHSHIDLLRTNCATGNVNFDLTCSMSHIHGVVYIHFILRKYFIHGKRPIQIMEQFIIRFATPKKPNTHLSVVMERRLQSLPAISFTHSRLKPFIDGY